MPFLCPSTEELTGSPTSLSQQRRPAFLKFLLALRFLRPTGCLEESYGGLNEDIPWKLMYVNTWPQLVALFREV